MTYRLVALDLDGTLLDSRLQIRADTIDALARVRAKGIQVMIVTGRHHVTAYPYWHQLGLESPAICCNGAYVYDFATTRPLAANPLSRHEATRLLELVRQHAIDTMIYVDEFMAYETESSNHANIRKWSDSLPENLRPRIRQVDSFERLVEQAPSIWKYFATGSDASAMRAFAVAVEQDQGLSCEWSGDNRLDITRADNNKGKRLAEWAAQQGIKPAEVIAFGDQQNDMEMLRIAGMGVAMGNSGEHVRTCADWVTGTNDSAGIADALHRFILTPA
jgi:hypothetical protein